MGAEPRWLTYDEVIDLHARIMERQGSLAGIRDAKLLHSAIARPRNRFHYEGEEDAIALAVELGIGLVRNHGFVDGNKRVGFLAIGLFLAANGLLFDAP